MIKYNIVYETQNFYTKPVSEALVELMVLPEDSPLQRCLGYSIHNSMEIQPYLTESLYGAKLIRFRIPRKFCSLSVTVETSVEIKSYNPFDIVEIPLENQLEQINDLAFQVDHCFYLSGSKYTKATNQILPGETSISDDESLFIYMQRINNWVNKHVTYQAGVTHTQTTLDDILQLQSGVCQDYAHLFISVMRKNGIPARYVTGYLNQGLSFLGSGAMHAWAEAFLPGTGWIGFDASNNLLADTNYVKVGHGLDYSDCMPIKGILVASGSGTTEYKVKVTQQQTQ